MRERWHGWVLGGVVAAHVAAAWWLAGAMQPTVRPGTSSVMWVEFIDSPPEPEPPDDADRAPAAEPAPDEARRDSARPSTPTRRRTPSSMQAIIEPTTPSAPEPAREFVASGRDPFHRPDSSDSGGFGRRGIAVLPSPNRPRLPGEAPPNAPLQGLRHRQTGTREVVETIAALVGGGPNAPVEAPCGGRMSGGFGTADSFSPNWQQQHGCGDHKERAGFDGRTELPPEVAGE